MQLTMSFEKRVVSLSLQILSSDRSKFIREAQLKIADLSLQLCHSGMKIFRLEQQVKEYKMGTKTSGGNSTESHKGSSPADAESDRIGLYARKFTIMNEYSVPKAAFLVWRPVGVRSDDLNHWNSPEDSLRGIITELYCYRLYFLYLYV
jgi:hypothetical protein